MNENVERISIPKLTAVLGIAAAVALTGVVLAMTQVAEHSADASKAFGQCNKNANKTLKAAGLKGKEKADARKAACKALKPIGNDTAGD